MDNFCLTQLTILNEIKNLKCKKRLFDVILKKMREVD